MKCDNLQFNLSVYLDDCLVEEERAVIDAHLKRCPLCRQKLADFQLLRSELRSLSRPQLPVNTLALIRNRVALATEVNYPEFALLRSENLGEWIQKRLMPYCIGTAASLLFGITLLWSLLSAAYIPDRDNTELAKFAPPKKTTVLLTDSNRLDFTADNEFTLNAVDFAAARLSVSDKSPSLNPQGALVALTKSIVRGEMKDDEVVIVADVFGNGLAQIAEVVEPSKDIRAVRELEKALKNDPNYAPFVPASFDNRSETVRVIFKINRVDIQTNSKPASKYR